MSKPTMVEHRRSHTNIIADILATATEGTLKTHIMNRANLNYTQLKKYLTLLLKEGLLETRKEGGWTIYATTKKGNELLQEISKNKEIKEDEKIRKKSPEKRSLSPLIPFSHSNA